jgi:spore germination protein
VYSKIAGALFPVFAIATVAVGIWGYQENHEKNAILIKAENQYQRAFHDLSFHMDKLQDELGKTLAVNSQKQIDGTLSHVWRLTSMAQSDVGQLPLTLMPFNKTEEFLSNTGKFAYETAIRNLDKEPLTTKEYEKLKQLHKQSHDVQAQLDGLRSKILQQHLRWMDVETALATEHQNVDNTIIDGLQTVDKKVSGYNEVDPGQTVQSMQNEKKFDDKNLTGSTITKEQAKQAALKFLGTNKAQVDVKEAGKGHDYTAYSVSIVPTGARDALHLDVTKKGGHVTWLLNNRDVTAQKLNTNQAVTRADQFLRVHGYRDMQLLVQENYGNVSVLTYVYTPDHVRVYPDTVTVKAALDTGDIIGYQAEQYVFNHKNRKLSKPKLTPAEARKNLNPHFQVKESRLAIVNNDSNQEVLCYEFVGSVENESYRVFIDAQNGKEVTIDKLDAPTSGKIKGA